MDEKEKEKIKHEAKEILDKFADALEKANIKEIEEAKIERDKDKREEKQEKEADKEFIKIMFENAPKTKNNCIEAEKGSWI